MDEFKGTHMKIHDTLRVNKTNCVNCTVWYFGIKNALWSLKVGMALYVLIIINVCIIKKPLIFFNLRIFTCVYSLIKVSKCFLYYLSLFLTCYMSVYDFWIIPKGEGFHDHLKGITNKVKSNKIQLI